jgi:hypothetical protein
MLENSYSIEFRSLFRTVLIVLILKMFYMAASKIGIFYDPVSFRVIFLLQIMGFMGAFLATFGYSLTLTENRKQELNPGHLLHLFIIFWFIQDVVYGLIVYLKNVHLYKMSLTDIDISIYLMGFIIFISLGVSIRGIVRSKESI